ncbi:MAG: DUF3347 domain-containing protein [Chitinivibrionales bacterium]|nr:DUF3347 domain-containing protein [Chitinivibrionales bacterium]
MGTMKIRLPAWSRGRWPRMMGYLALLVAVFWLGTRVVDRKTGAGVDHFRHSGSHAHAEDTTWTCSMHPQIKMPEPGKCPICFMDLVPLQGGSGDDGGDRARLTMSEHAKALAGIVTVPAARRGASATIRMTGKAEVDESRMEMITARVGGRIDRLFVDYTGVPVKRGDHLARIYSPELVTLQRELIEAERARDRLGANASASVRRGVERTLAAAKEKMRLLGFADWEINRVLERGATSDHMTIRAGQAGVVLKRMVEEGSYVQTGTPLFHIARLDTLWVMLDAYEMDLQWLRLGQTAFIAVEAHPGDTFRGTVSFIDPVVDPQTRTVGVRVIVPNGDRRLKPDMFVRAVVEVKVSRGGGVTASSLRGKLVCPMHPQVVKDKPGTCDICGMPLVPAEELGYVTSGFEELDPLLIPATAPLITGRRALVYVEDKDADEPAFEAREVVLGPRVGDSYVVKSGLAEGESVVVNGAFKIDAELQIRARPSMMSPEQADASHSPATGGPADDTQAPRPAFMPDIAEGPVDPAFLDALTPLFDAYFAAWHALAADNVDSAGQHLRALGDVLSSVEAPLGERYDAFREASARITEALRQVSHARDAADMRMLFETVSNNMIVLQRHYGHLGAGERYLAFCPMAFGNEGAYWLQTSEQIVNPYFGARMLKCGEIRETYEGRSDGQ